MRPPALSSHLTCPAWLDQGSNPRPLRWKHGVLTRWTAREVPKSGLSLGEARRGRDKFPQPVLNLMERHPKVKNLSEAMESTSVGSVLFPSFEGVRSEQKTKAERVGSMS